MIQNRLILFQNPLYTKSGIMKLLCISRYLLFRFVKDILQVTHTTQFITKHTSREKTIMVRSTLKYPKYLIQSKIKESSPTILT